MSSRRPSSSSQSNQWCGDYTWDVPSASTLEGCGRRLSELSLMSPSVPPDAESPGNAGPYRPYWKLLDSPAVPSTHQSSFANPSWGSTDTDNHSSDPPGYWTYSEPDPISSERYLKFEPSTLSGPANDGSTEYETGFTDSMHVSPSSSAPSKRSTMDDSQGTQRYAEPRRSGRKSSSNEASRHNKKNKWNSATYQEMTPRSSRKSHPTVISTEYRDKSARYSPYPRVLDDNDLYDLPGSSSSGAHDQSEQYGYTTTRSPNRDEDWDFCDSVASPFSTIECPNLPEPTTWEK
ncbi:hypothetical protein V8F06_003967 [Rhypophila decipiens]